MKTITFLIITLTAIQLPAQSLWQTVNASGSNTQVSFSIGNLTQTYAENGFSLSQGFQQVFDSSVFVHASDIKNLREGHLFPNPSSDILNLSWEPKSLTWKVFCSDGSICLMGNGNIQISSLPPGFYYLQIDQRRLSFVKN